MIEVEKTYEQIEKDKKEKQKKKADYQWQLDNLEEWRQHWVAREEQAKVEAELKAKAPLVIEPTYEFEKLPEWKDHLAKSYRLGIEFEILKNKAELYQVEQRIKLVTEMMEEVDKDE